MSKIIQFDADNISKRNESMTKKRIEIIGNIVDFKSLKISVFVVVFFSIFLIFSFCFSSARPLSHFHSCSPHFPRVLTAFLRLQTE